MTKLPHSIYLLLFVVVTLGNSSCCEKCTLFDNLEDCHNVELIYRYIPVEEDEYESNISSLKHFLFDSKGLFIKEIPQNKEHPQRLFLSGLPFGHYTMLTIGNYTPSLTFLSSLTPLKSSLQKITLQLQKRFNEKAFAPSEELFWNFREFEVKQSSPQSYICDLANIHCHLIFQVSWQSAPPAAGKYRIELTNLSKGYNLDPAKSNLKLIVNPSKEIIHTFPLHSPETTAIYQDISLFNHQLEGEIISLRYQNDRIPIFQIKKEGRPITKPLPFVLPFRQFNWYPDNRAEQIYRVQIRINDDGSVTIHPWYDGSIEDWQAGGTVMQ